MATKECERCHRRFEYNGFYSVCPVCAPLEEEEFKRIKEYLMAHQGANSSELVRELNISVKQIKRYLREERIEIIGDIKDFLLCEICRKPISSGKFCSHCYKEGMSIKKGEQIHHTAHVSKLINELNDKASKQQKQQGIQYNKKK